MKKIMTTVLMSTLLMSGVGVLSSCKDYEEEKIQEMTLEVGKNQQELANLKTELDALKKKLEDEKCKCNFSPEQLQKLKDFVDQTLDKLGDYATKDDVKAEVEAYAAGKYVEEALKKLQEWVGDAATDKSLQEIIDGIEENFNDVTETVSKLNGSVTAINNEIITINNNITQMAEDLQKAIDDAAAAKAQADVNAEWIEANKDIAQTLQTEVDNLKEYIDNLVKETADNFQAALDLTNDAVAALQSQVDGIAADVAELQDKYDTLKSDLADLAEVVYQNKADIAELSQKIDDLTGRVQNLENAMANLVTGILVQGTENPVFGSFSIPANINSNVLIAFYGKSLGYLSFPTYANGEGAAQYIWASQALTDKEWSMLNLGDDDLYTVSDQGLLLGDNADNAGKLYLTVNPAEVDFTGLNVTLENSQAKSAGVELSPLRKSDKTLSFGYSRAADNGFYEADARIEHINDVQKLDFDGTGFKNIAKDLVTDIRHFDYVTAAKTVYNQFNDIVDANAVKAEYEGVDGNRSVYSNYVLAATAVKPLSYGFAKDFTNKYNHVPGYERAEKLIDRFNKAVRVRIKSIFKKFEQSSLISKIENLNIKHIEIKDLDESLLAKFKVTIDKEFSLGGKTLHFDIDKDVEIPIYFEQDVALDGINVTIPTMVVDANGKGIILIPIVDENGDPAVDANGNAMFAEFDAGTLDIEAESTETTVTINGEKIHLVVDQMVQTHLTLKDLTFVIPDSDEFTFSIYEVIDLGPEIEELWGVVKDQMGGVNQMLDDIAAIVQDINDLLSGADSLETTINGYVDKLTDKLKEYLDKVNSLGMRVINGAIARLQPCLLVSTSAGTKIGRNTVNQPQVVKGTTVTLVPTSYTFEMITPAFKKHVACVNVMKNGESAQKGDAALQAELKRVNDVKGMNEVIEGTKQALTLELKSGYTYQFAYSAVDYAGKICTKRAVIRVK